MDRYCEYSEYVMFDIRYKAVIMYDRNKEEPM